MVGGGRFLELMRSFEITGLAKQLMGKRFAVFRRRKSPLEVQSSQPESTTDVGQVVGSIVAAYINEPFGRKVSLTVTAVISIVGVIIELTSAIGSSRYSQFVVGKTIASIAMGMALNIVPMYLSETSTAAARGFSVNMYQNLILVGAITASGVVYGTSQLQTAACYLIPIGLQLIAPTFLILLTPLLPESPRWLATKGRTGPAIKAADRLFKTKTNNFEAADYVHKIHLSIEQDRANQEATGWMDLARGPNLRRLLIAVGIQCIQQAQGVTYILNYITFYLGYAGITNVFPYIISAFCTNYLGVLTGYYLPDRFGRRVLVICTSLVCAVALVIMSGIMAGTSGGASGTVIVVLLFIWMLSLGAQSPLIWIITAESAPTRNREKVIATAVFFGFGTALLTASVSPFIADPGYGNLGGKIGFLWAGFSFLSIVWVYFVLPEMKALSLEQLDFLFNNHVPTRKFSKYVFTDLVLAVHEKDVHETTIGNEDSQNQNKNALEETVELRR
ncbi:hypothetical protein PV08_07926 [Exophiala spinifera]|uniref:Major facilitator superfamily (MFS) profile domain-containing protein n=1 Tax=Exophiala spinifera TaxID=91928 RepID=A0A0D2B296_9EURO|nr:uncharacterized protein PV08_07926 [Exophiala spinifera]KIW12740.1 hypothetical protein PV08_07926 [Exophiala spinifera]